MRVVVDTNVIASAIFFGGKPQSIINLIMNGRIDAFVTKEILEEYTDTINYLKNKYPGKKSRIPLIEIEEKCNVIESHSSIHICRDPDDNKFIECAQDSACYYIVSGDKDLLSIRNYNGIKILTVTKFLELIS